MDVNPDPSRNHINGANSRCLTRITGKSIHQEVSDRTQTFDINTEIRVRKWKCIVCTHPTITHRQYHQIGIKGEI